MKKNFFTILAVMLMSLTANAQHEYVDLGLPSGTLWATCNVGANSPEEEGDEFAWGETTPYTGAGNYSFHENPAVLDPENDAATQNWGSIWRMPSIEQCEELINEEYTTSVNTTLNGVEGVRFTGKNGNSIFLPSEQYWSNNISGELYPSTARGMVIGEDCEHVGMKAWMISGFREHGRLVRPVFAGYTISNIPSGWKVNGSTNYGTYGAEEGETIVFTPKNIPAGKKIKSIKAVKQ